MGVQKLIDFRVQNSHRSLISLLRSLSILLEPNRQETRFGGTGRKPWGVTG
jgi:hypothetical protein